MSDRPQFNLFTKPSVAAPITSMQQAAAVQVPPRTAPATSTSDHSASDRHATDNNSIYSESESSSGSEKASDPEISPVQSPASPRSAADKIHDLKAAQYNKSADQAHKVIDKTPLGETELNVTTKQGSVSGPPLHSDLISLDTDQASKATKKDIIGIKMHETEDRNENSMKETVSDAANEAVNEVSHKVLEESTNPLGNSPESTTSDGPDAIMPAEVENINNSTMELANSPKQASNLERNPGYLISIDQLKEIPPESEPPGWLKQSREASDSEDHRGALRRHSLQMMKELGPPETPAASSESNNDGSDVVFDYAKFMSHLRSKPADPIARYIKSFLQEFCRGHWTPAQQEKIVADFLRFIAGRLREHEPFASMTKKERRNSLEGVEKLIMTRLYTRTFPPSIPPLLRTDGHNEDLLRDQLFAERMRLWGWVEGRHLDINNEYISQESTPANFVQLATRELGRLNQFKSPRDKMICILNCSKVIFALIRQAKLEQNADSFLPLLIYVVIKSQPDHLVSTINFIQRFRNREFQRGETAYYLSTLASAVAFLEKIDKTSLTISDEEFESRMAESVQAETDRLVAERDHPLGTPKNSAVDRHSHNPEGESSAAVLATSAGMLVDRMRKMTTKLWEDLGTDDNEQPPASISSNSNQQRQAQLDYRAQTRAAARASLDEYESAQSQHQKFEESLESLHNMFPLLEKDLIADVLHQNGTNLGSAVDLCLALSN